MNSPDGTGAPFPRKYIVDLLAYLKGREDVEFITYDDLDWDHGWDAEHSYPEEYRRWKEWKEPEKIYMLIQHDVDSNPGCTMELLEEERKLDVCTNIMVFNRRINRRKFKETGIIEYTPYELDWQWLGYLSRLGFVIGYHCNAVERAYWDLPTAYDIFRDDIEELKTRLDTPIHFWSAHGGVWGANGLNNHAIKMKELDLDIRQVHNIYGPKLDGHYSDGGFMGRDPEGRDLRVFIRDMQPGKRYRLLIHPQYYGSGGDLKGILTDCDWAKEINEIYKNGGNAWDRTG